MARRQSPSSDGDWHSNASAIDLVLDEDTVTDLPPPSKSFMKKKAGKLGGGGGLGLNLGKGKGKGQAVRRKVK
ncbi:hypothetical protein IFR04_011128, partial [Cadophora malorum]